MGQCTTKSICRKNFEHILIPYLFFMFKYKFFSIFFMQLTEINQHHLLSRKPIKNSHKMIKEVRNLRFQCFEMVKEVRNLRILNLYREKHH